jgi:lipopolysaccharide transport system ATP-binding protein
MAAMIVARDLGKYYQPRQKDDWLVDALARRIKSLARSQTGPPPEGRWVLRGASFDIGEGEVVGIVGRNGAGKTTLLKILSRVTDPSEGRCTLFGRVGSLLEVGTGFHPELTGAENILLAGAILGMRRHEVKQRFDEIVAFAEADAHLDLPVKRYSSGMAVRLGFAVAAHLATEIILVDEVLAVGDLGFQRKCVGRMTTLAAEGRTVLLVSHNLGLVQRLCTRAILLAGGGIVADGDVDSVVRTYTDGSAPIDAPVTLLERVDRRGSGETRLLRVSACGAEPEVPLRTGSTARFEFGVSQLLPSTTLNFGIYSELGEPLMHFTTSALSPSDGITKKPYFECSIDELPLVPGRYQLNVEIRSSGVVQDHVEAAVVFDVEQGLVRGRSLPLCGGSRVFVPHSWVVPEEVLR